jgi:deoxyadenosine/deoxycytidine kinase
MNSNNFISVIGNIGSGKSTLIKYLNSQITATIFYENPKNYIFLEDSFKYPKRWSFHNQLDFLIVKYTEIMDCNPVNKTIIQEMDFEATHKIWTPVLRELNYISKKEELLLNNIYNVISNNIFEKKNIKYLYIKTPYQINIDRVFKRDRSFEDINKMKELISILNFKLDDFFKKNDFFLFDNSYKTFDLALIKNKNILFNILKGINH